MKETTTGRWLTGRSALVLLVLGMFASLWLSETAATQEKSWQPLAPMLQERFEHACALVGETFYVLGGYGKGVKTSNHVQAFDLARNKWRRLKDMPSAITHINTVVDGRSVWIAGGFKDGYPGKAIGGQFHHDSRSGKPALDQARVDIYNPGTDSWSSGPALPRPHSHAENSTFLHKGRIFVIGGRSVNRVEAAIWVLSAEGKWSQFGKLLVPLIGPAARIIDGRLVVAGGAPRGFDPLSAVWAETLSQ